MDDNDTEKPKRAAAKKDGPPPTEVSELIESISGGEFNATASKKLAQLIEACEATGGSGQLVITLKVKKENRMLVIRPTFKGTLPELAVDSDMFYVDEHSRLTKNDPKQMRIKFAPSTPKGAEVIDLNNKTKPQPPTE